MSSEDDLHDAVRSSSETRSIEERIRHAQQQVRIYDALSRALGDAHAVLDLIMNAADRDGASAALQEAYGFDEMQAAALLDLQFGRVGTRERSQIREAHREMQTHLAALEAEHPGASGGGR
jgi:DNA gyrase subunit A